MTPRFRLILPLLMAAGIAAELAMGEYLLAAGASAGAMVGLAGATFSKRMRRTHAVATTSSNSTRR